MTYKVLTNPQQIFDHELLMIEADISSVSSQTLKKITPLGENSASLLSHLREGRYLLLSDTGPKTPLFLKQESSDQPFGSSTLVLNSQADEKLASNLSHISYEKAYQKTTNLLGVPTNRSLSSSTDVIYEKPQASAAERRIKQQQGEDTNGVNKVQARFSFRISKGEQLSFGNWSGEREVVADVAWRLTQDGTEIATGSSSTAGSFLVEDLPSTAACLLEFGLPDSDGYPRQQTIKVNHYTHIELNSFVFSHYYDDFEHTPVHETPFQLTFENGDTQEGVTDSQGQVVMGPFIHAVKEVEFYPNESEEDIFGRLRELNQSLEDLITECATAAATDIAEAYGPIHTEELSKEDQVKADFKQSVEDRINELKRQAAEYDAQEWHEKAWDLALAAGEGTIEGVTGYLPDLGSFGKLLDKMQMDVAPSVLIKALVRGDVDELEAAFQQWKSRSGGGYEEASEKMEVVIILLKDPQIREMVLSLPQRFLEEAPTDALVEFGFTQASQTTVDRAAVAGATGLGTMISGPGGLIAGGITTSATLSRKAAKAMEGVSDILMKQVDELVMLRNKGKEPVKGHAHESETTNKGKESKTKPKKCKWQDCTTEHNPPIKYPNTGRTTRKSGFNKVWAKEGLEPWNLHGKGKALPDIFLDPEHKGWELGYGPSALPLKRKIKNKIKASIAAPEAGDAYPVAAHHLIPVSAFKRLKKLKKNARLIGWSVNAPENGIFLPELTPDIYRHGLQIHRGSHPKSYKEAAEEALEEIEKESASYCRTGKQKLLVKELNYLSDDIKDTMEDWEEPYLIHTNNVKTKEDLEKIIKGEEV